MRQRKIQNVVYGVDRDPRGGWKAWWKVEGFPFPPRKHECATRWGAVLCAWRRARLANRDCLMLEEMRRVHGYIGG